MLRGTVLLCSERDLGSTVKEAQKKLDAWWLKCQKDMWNGAVNGRNQIEPTKHYL
jgi:hypothetical protein